ncbi:MAG: chemotaxis protein CheD [Clostridiales bacterium]|nr:chemotaxis protein CheD [Clostridiales bacterium]
MSKSIIIGISDLNIALSPDVLITYALGSCVGIALYDQAVKVAGLAHIMLPLSSEARDKSNIMKFADTATLELINQMEKMGASRRRITAKIAGGAQMFALQPGNEAFNIGKRNVIATKQILNDLNIRIIAEDTGMNYGRTVEFSADTGMLKVKSIAHGIKEI